MSSRLRFALPVAWMGVLWMLSSVPAHTEGRFVGFRISPIIQNGAHVIVYAVLAAAWFWALGTKREVIPRMVVALSLGYGVIDEIHQGFVPGRTSSLLDLFLDGVGIACVVWAVRTFLPTDAAPYVTTDSPLSP